ncbi:MAG: class I SAM-dependent methyltransferase [Chitinophagaceae bacterium]
MRKLKSILIFLQSFPISVILWKFKCKILNSKIPQLEQWQQYFVSKNGIEIGGPSAIFKTNGFLPLYKLITNLDGVNFSNKTVWEGNLSERMPFVFEGKKGRQYISEGSNLEYIENYAYDFVISCNNLEHIANPIKAIYEWKRVLKSKGVLLLILPKKEANFDHKREFTQFNHLIEDFKSQTNENDLTHVEEILKKHDLKRDPQAGSFKSFESRCYSNLENRCLHHHVFSENLLKGIILYCEMEVKITHTSKTDIFILAENKF